MGSSHGHYPADEELSMDYPVVWGALKGIIIHHFELSRALPCCIGNSQGDYRALR